MTLAELLSGPLPDADELRLLCIVMDGDLAQRMVNVHSWHGDPRCTAFPVGLEDGRWCAPADVLPDCLSPGGMYQAGFSRLDSSRFDEIEVVPLADVELADPPPPPLQPEPPPAP